MGFGDKLCGMRVLQEGGTTKIIFTWMESMEQGLLMCLYLVIAVISISTTD